MAKKTLLERGICVNGHDIKSVADIYRVFQNGKAVSICKICQQHKSLLRSRIKNGTPLNQPIRQYKERRAPNRTKATMELIRLVSSDPELAKKLLEYVPQARRSISSRRALTRPINDNC
jgi:ABC-type antimicrobial peptide transport system ATPase subunit